MPGRSASRRAFLGAAGAGVATAGAMSLEPAHASVADGGGTAAPGTGEQAIQAVAPPAIPGTLTKTLLFSEAGGYAVGATSPLAWAQGAYQAAGGFLNLSLGLDAGAVIRRIDVYVQRVTSGSVNFSLVRGSITSSTAGFLLDSITTASGTGILTGGKTMTVPVAVGDQYYLESLAFTSSNVTFLGAIVTYVPAPLPQPVTPPALTARSFTFTASKKSVARGKSVTLSGSLVSASQACLAAQTVLLEKSTKGSNYKTAGSLTTDAGGAFTSTQKIKRKTSYRVSVAATATCAAAQSAAVTVKVKPRA
jgi:hypothetical protein